MSIFDLHKTIITVLAQQNLAFDKVNIIIPVAMLLNVFNRPPNSMRNDFALLLRETIKLLIQYMNSDSYDNVGFAYDRSVRAIDA